MVKIVIFTLLHKNTTTHTIITVYMNPLALQNSQLQFRSRLNLYGRNINFRWQDDIMQK